jgi:hypothetical protein
MKGTMRRWFATNSSEAGGAPTQVPSAVASLWGNAPPDAGSQADESRVLSGEWATWKAAVAQPLPDHAMPKTPSHAPASPDHHHAAALQDPAIAAASPATPPRTAAPTSPATPLTPNSQIARLLNINQTPVSNKPTQPAPAGEVKLPTPVAPMRPNNSLLNKLLSGGISGCRCSPVLL